ncbi:Hypothetical predicted protein [Mytilus galloprovincialis]|uniref:Uncharacterized protein n=1 Tax=Mytilus galloprovincialis TaxID=29158 RepID=A0A8B6EQB5_MYTGA|nr:Hypothetical predicted protein [Mytilus galloprovincialis]
MLILNSYAKNICKWQAVYSDVSKDAQKLPDRVKSLYTDAKFYRRKMSDQISRLVTKDPVLIPSKEIKQLITQVQDSEGRFSTKNTLKKEKQLANTIFQISQKHQQDESQNMTNKSERGKKSLNTNYKKMSGKRYSIKSEYWQ